jgi:hypothetical protein
MPNYKRMPKADLYNLMESGKTVDVRSKASEEWFKKLHRFERRMLWLIFLLALLATILAGAHVYFKYFKLSG